MRKRGRECFRRAIDVGGAAKGHERRVFRLRQQRNAGAVGVQNRDDRALRCQAWRRLRRRVLRIVGPNQEDEVGRAQRLKRDEVGDAVGLLGDLGPDAGFGGNRLDGFPALPGGRVVGADECQAEFLGQR